REGAAQVGGEALQLERGLAESAELFAQDAVVERAGVGLEAVHLAARAGDAAESVAGLDVQRLADFAADVQLDADLPLRRGEALQLARQLGVLRLPDHVRDLDEPQV